MCRVMVMTGIKNSKNALLFMRASLQFMSKGNRDGVGYAAIGGDGKLFSERWLDPDLAFHQTNESNKLVLEELGGGLEVETKNYKLHGDLNVNDMKSLIYHTRFATCSKTFENVHPFISGNTALIHNGVIRNEFQSPLRKEISSCDSEVILNSYLDNTVNYLPSGIQDVTDILAGYWACGVLSEDEYGSPILDVFRNDAGAKLYVGYIEEIGAKVFCTDSDIIFKTLGELKWKTNFHCYLTKPHVMLRFDAMTGKLLSTTEIDNSFNYGNWHTQNETTKKGKRFQRQGRTPVETTIPIKELTPLVDDTPASDSKYSDSYAFWREEMEEYKRTAHSEEKQYFDLMTKPELDDYLFERIR